MRTFLNKFGLFIAGIIIIFFFATLVSDEASIIAWAVTSILVMLTIFLIERIKQKRTLDIIKAEKANAELTLLKAQISPHFFFNTLNNLYSLALKKSDETPEVILKLSEIMRYTIYRAREPFVTVEEEINYLKNYLDIQSIRFNDNVPIDFKVIIKNKKQKIAPLLLIILIENAFKHGVEILRKDAHLSITLKDYQKGLYFEVINNFDIDSRRDPPGIGLRNLKKRLELLYFNRHQLKITSYQNKYKAVLILDT